MTCKSLKINYQFRPLPLFFIQIVKNLGQAYIGVEIRDLE